MVTLTVSTIASGFFIVAMPREVYATISVSETFVFAGTLIFGASVGTVLVLLDALVISLRLWSVRKVRGWEQIAFNLTAPPLSIWLAAHLARIRPVSFTQASIASWQFWAFVFGLAVFTSLYFLLNSSLVTLAVALQRNVKAFGIWRDNFKDLRVNYFASASIAALMVISSHNDAYLAFILLMFPLIYSFWATYTIKDKTIKEALKKNVDLKNQFRTTVGGLARYIEGKDSVSSEHIQRVQRYAMALADAIGMTDENERDALEAAALLHDTGKIAVPDHILDKPGALTSSEFEKMKEHAAFGAEIIKSLGFPYPVAPLVRHHHERWDGSGYPDGLKGPDIPLGARILAVVDSYDALTSDRQYRPRMTRQQAEQLLRDGRGRHYDPPLVDAFLRILDQVERRASDEETRSGQAQTTNGPTPVEVISTTSAEDREFRELIRDLPKTTSLAGAADALFQHLRRVVPAASMALYVPRRDGSMLDVVACSGVGASTISELSVPIGDRISGWAFAHRQVVVNSDATLEFGPVARTFSVPIRYALVVPLLEGQRSVAVLGAFGSDPFEKDHQRLLETAATLFHSVFSILSAADGRGQVPQGPEKHKSKVH